MLQYGNRLSLYNSIRFVLFSVFLEMIRHQVLTGGINEGERCRHKDSIEGLCCIESSGRVMELSSLFTLVDNSLLPINDIINGVQD